MSDRVFCVLEYVHLSSMCDFMQTVKHFLTVFYLMIYK